VKQDMVLAKLNHGVITIAQSRLELGYSNKWTPDYLNTYIMQTQNDSLENIFNKNTNAQTPA
jgi:hypothetical protein